MKFLRRFFMRMFHSAAMRTYDERLREEIEEHVALQTDENVRAGLSRAEARRQALLKFGGREAVAQEYRAEQSLAEIENWLQDVRFSLRVLRKSPGFTLTAVFTMALGIGASAVVFAALNAIVLRPLNVPQPESLYSIHRIDTIAAQSYPDYLDLRDRNRSFEDLAAYQIELVGLDMGEEPSRAFGIAASGNYFDVLHIQPYLGRLFHGSDEHGPSSAAYVVLSYSYWHAHFHDDPGVVGRTLQLNKHPFTVIGVTPSEFRGTLMIFSPDLFVPMVNQEQIDAANLLNDRANRGAIFMTLGHLKPGVTTAEAAADVNSIWSDLVKAYPKEHAPCTFVLGRPSLYGERLGHPMRAFLSALMLLALLILIAACANLGSLFAARAADRSREVALRLALGARRMRILRQLFTEALLVSAAGGALGICGALLLLRSLRTWQPFPQWPINVPVTPDANVYGVAVLLIVISGLMFGAVPVRQVLHTDPYQIVKAGSRSATTRRVAVRDFLLVGQIAICAVLVTSSLVAVRGLARVLQSNFGFEPRNALLVNTLLDMAGYDKNHAPAMQKRMLEEVQTIPGVTSVALVDLLPLNGGVNPSLIFREETSDLRSANAAVTVDVMKVSPGYFRTAGTALLAGTEFTWHDDKDAPRVAVINSEFARRLFGSANSAIDRYFKLRDGSRIRVVGIAEDGKYEHLTEDPTPAMFLPILQSPASDTWMVVRSSADAQGLAMAIKEKLKRLDSGLPSSIQTWNSAMALPQFPARMATAALGVLGLMAAMLSVTGIFGMAAYSVSRRLKELGTLIALGAQSRQVLQAALGRPVRLLTLGSIAGLFLGILASRVLSFIVYHATPRDPMVLAGVVLVLAFLGVLATWIPAQRALSVNPLILLREE